MDFKNAQELLALCEEHQLPISEIMRQREITVGESTADSVDSQMKRVLEIMKDAAFSPIKSPVKSMGGLIGGEAKQITGYRESGTNVCGTFMNKLIAYSMAVLEVNASMGVIVAAPTAGSSGRSAPHAASPCGRGRISLPNKEKDNTWPSYSACPWSDNRLFPVLFPPEKRRRPPPWRPAHRHTRKKFRQHRSRPEPEQVNIS